MKQYNWCYLFVDEKLKTGNVYEPHMNLEEIKEDAEAKPMLTSNVHCHNTKSMKKDRIFKICFYTIGLMILLTVVVLGLAIWLTLSSGKCKVIEEVSVDGFGV